MERTQLAGPGGRGPTAGGIMTIRSDEPLSAGSGPGPDGGRGPAHEAGAADAVVGPSASGGGGAADSSGGAPDSRAADGPRANGPGRGVSGPSGGAPSGGAHAFLSEEGPDSDFPGDATGSGLEADGASVDDLPVDDPVDDLPADDGGGMSPVVREYTERLRREALARDAELRARGIDPYKGAGVDGGRVGGWARGPWRYWPFWWSRLCRWARMWCSSGGSRITG